LQKGPIQRSGKIRVDNIISYMFLQSGHVKDRMNCNSGR
jgi:hypothetical protein